MRPVNQRSQTYECEASSRIFPIPPFRPRTCASAASRNCIRRPIVRMNLPSRMSSANSRTFYKPSGPLSGVSTVAILVWLVTWGILEWRWRNRTVALRRISASALALLGLSLLLTFPPIVDLF